MRREPHVRFWEGPGVQVPRATRLVITFERPEDAGRVMAVLPKRMGRFGLTRHPDKTRLLPFRRPPATQTSGKGPATFDFLGFTLYWQRTRKGGWWMRCKTRRERQRWSIQAVADWCRGHRHEPVKAQHASLVRCVQGHLNYFGVNGNSRSLGAFVRGVEEAWYKWLRRRSQQKHLTWKKFGAMLKRLPLPRPRIVVPIWGT